MIISSRRNFFAGLASSTAVLLPKQTTRAENSTSVSAAIPQILTPQSEEGPFYLDPILSRTDISEGKPGVPLDMSLKVIESNSGQTISDARVDIWHCDAQGLYSGYPGQSDTHTIDASGKTFLRGTQTTTSAGLAKFETIYPGWYEGRATHIHFKVFVGQKNVLTGQMFFPDALNEFLYANVDAYGGRRNARAIMNANDHVATGADPEHNGFCAIKEEADRYLATLTLSIDRDATPQAERRPSPSPHFVQGARPPGWPPLPPALKGAERLAALVPRLRRKS